MYPKAKLKGIYNITCSCVCIPYKLQPRLVVRVIVAEDQLM